MANNALDNCIEQIINYDGNPGTQIGTGYLPLCPDSTPCANPQQRRDCNCNCLFPTDSAFAYETSCGCFAGGLCRKNCSDGSITNPLETDTYCFSDQECSQESSEDDYNVMSKPSFRKMWMFQTSNFIFNDPTVNQQLSTYLENGTYNDFGPHDINTVFYFKLKVNNVLVEDDQHTIFAVINNELRGITTIKQTNDIYYGYLDVVWKQEQEANQIIEVFVHDNSLGFWQISQFQTPDGNFLNPSQFLTNAEYYEF